MTTRTKEEMMELLDLLKDETELEMCVKLTASTMLQQLPDGMNCQIFVVQKEPTDVVRFAAIVLNFIVQYYPLIGYSYRRINDVLHEAEHYNFCYLCDI